MLSYRRSCPFSHLLSLFLFEVWRLLTHNLVWGSSSELVLGSILLYTWRLFERQFGSRKFGGCILFHFLSTTILQTIILAFSGGVIQGGRNWLFASGPYGLAFGLLACFAWDIPQSAPFKLFGIKMSDKIFIYMLALQLALSGVPSSAYTALIGLVLGILYRIEFLPFHRIRIPVWFANLCSTIFSPILSGSIFATLAGVNPQGGQPAGGRRFVGGGGRLGGGPPGARNNGSGVAVDPSNSVGGYQPIEPEGEVLMGPDAFPAPSAPYAPAHVQPDPNAVAQIVAMGFSEERARTALRATRNDVTAATNQLLGI